MKLERLTLNNFRQYHGRQRVEFSQDPNRHVTVVHGVNGAGKTSMFMALNWCLYGKDVIKNVGELISKEALTQSRMGQLTEMSVELTFNHHGRRYIMKRVMGATRQIDGRIEPYSNEELLMRRITADGQSKRENSPITTINAILPANVRTYFLFNGEKINEFAKPEAAGEVKDAIYLVLRLEILDRARKHLKENAKTYRKEFVKASGDKKLEELEREVENKEAKQQETERRLAEVKAQVALAKTHIKDLNEQLSGMEGIRALHEERIQAEDQLTETRRLLEKGLNEIQAKATAAYFIGAKPVIQKALLVLDDKRAKGQIPSNIRQQFVQDLLNELVCVCGRPLEEHDQAYQKLEGLMSATMSNSLENEVLDTNTSLHTFLVESEAQAAEINRLMRERVQAIEKIRELEGKLGDLRIQLKDSALEDVRGLEQNREKFQADIESYTLEQGAFIERLAKLDEDIGKLMEKIGQAKKRSARAEYLSQKLEIAKNAAKAIDDIYDRFADEMRLQIESRTNEIFQSLIWKESHFDRINLGADYNLEIIDRYGMAARPELSAGERQVLSLSFIAAMAQVSGEEAPLVMDTPFSRLSKHHRESITQHLPKLASQLVLLVTDEELHGQARRNIEPFIGAEFRLDFDRKTSCTRIEEL